MGGNCSSLLADLFLSFCEFDFLTKCLREKKYGLCKLLSNTSRYVDDICIINYKHFSERLAEIYPHDLAAERSGSDDHNVAYLDVLISINESNVRTSIYHKVDDFDFNVVLMTFPGSNMPVNIGYNVFASQVLRYGRICSDSVGFINRTNNLYQLLASRGYRKQILLKYLDRCLNKSHHLLNKFGWISSLQIKTQLLS